MTKPKTKADDTEQSRRFLEAAKELEADESGAKFDRAVQPLVLANAKRPPPESGVAAKKTKG
ncbi:hypothetical protein [Thiomonas delicata]|uniref:Uncharacterized protein n=1 Tax=Thiomonas delicata TaxID=364030 RepID=A0A238D3X9_THIDL|nr:hypothetical protein [Thiomonas delicata]SBP88006.1 conserved hypothetical protein [Thiomonas delicata]